MDDEKTAGPSSKKVRVASPRQGNSKGEESKWRKHIIDVLEVANTEHQAACPQFVGICQVIEYIPEAVYHHFVVGSETKEWGE